jgi:hypothetical protein
MNTTCKNCGSQQINNYCSNCGQLIYTKRFTTKSFLLKVLEVLDIEKGFFFALKKLLINPGKVINDYLSGRTKVYFNPLKFYIIIAGISAVLMIWLDIYDANIKNTNELIGVNQTQALQFQQSANLFIKQYINVFSLLLLPFLSLGSLWFYHKRKLFYGEHLIINCFLMAEVSAVSIILYPFYKIIPALSDNIILIGFALSILYYSYSLKSIFKGSIFKSLIGAIFINLISYLLFFILIILLTIVVIIVLKFSGFNIQELLK